MKYLYKSKKKSMDSRLPIGYLLALAHSLAGFIRIVFGFTSTTLNEVLGLLVAAVHFRPEKENLPRNKAVLLPLVESALKQGAELVVTPELSLSGFAFGGNVAELEPHAEVVPGPFTADVQGLTRTYGGTVVVGMAEKDAATGNLYNSAVVIESAGLVGRYRQSPWARPKPGSPDFPEELEKFLARGSYLWANSPPINPAKINTQVGPIDVVLCADITRLDQPLPGQPPNLLAVPANWDDDPLYPSPRRDWQEIARERGVALVIANRYGDETYSDGLLASFSSIRTISCIIDDSGQIRARSRLQHDQIVLARL